MDITTAQLMVVIVGVVSSAFSLFFAWYFWQGRERRFARVLTYMFGAEAVANIAATYFAFQSLLNLYNTMTPEETIVLRLIIFISALGSSIKMVAYVLSEQEKIRDIDNRHLSKVEKSRERE